jgi:hypothetical protein
MNATGWARPIRPAPAYVRPDESSRKLFCLSDSDVLFHGEFEVLSGAP